MFEFYVGDDIRLRLLEPHHADRLFTLVDANRDYLREWLPWLDNNTSVAESLQFIQTTQKQFADNKGFVTGIWYRDELAGVVGHNKIDWDNRISYIGYWLGAKFQGNGIMTKSCRAIINHAFNEYGLNQIEIGCATGNQKSRAIPERLGFRQKATIQQAEWLYDKFVDHVVYVMLAADWQNQDNSTI